MEATNSQETLKDVILKSFEGFPLSQDVGRIIWAALANNSLFPKEVVGAHGEDALKEERGRDYDLSGSFRYNGGQIADALNEMLGTHFDYMTFYCSNATEEECRDIMFAFENSGYVWVVNKSYTQYIEANPKSRRLGDISWP